MIKLQNVEKKYKDFALNCSLEFKKGRITALIGANGSGKSTMFKSILGLNKLDGGSITIMGKDINSMSQQDRQQIVATVPDSGFNNYFNLVDIKKILKRYYSNFNSDLFDKLVKESNLPEKKKIKEFSTGMKAKLKIIAALSSNAKILILDEPTSGLDVIARNSILDLIKDYMNEDKTIVISSHISTDLESICDDVFLIDNGNIIIESTMEDLLNKYSVAVFRKSDFENLEEPILNLLLAYKEDRFHYVALTDKAEELIKTVNHLNVQIQRANIDDIMTTLVGGRKL